MKHKLFFLILSMLAFQACENCMITELEAPAAFDCPDLMANIGDPCDDNNPDTEHDLVDANCICVGEVINNCTGILYTSRLGIDANGNVDGWFFDAAGIAPGQAIVFTNIEEKTNGFLYEAEPFNTNFAAFDPVNEVYAYAYQYEVGTPNPLYLATTNSFSSGFLEQEVFYAAPVFLNGELYAIDVQYDAPNANYSILRIDQNTGLPTVLFSDMLVVNSPMVNVAISSTTNGSNLLYFASATNLIVFDSESVTATYVDIDPSHNPDNQVVYYGLEYQQDVDRVLAIKGKWNSTETVAELVSISTDGTYTLSTVFDIKNNLSSDNDEQVFFEFYSTAFSQCNNNYYISELVELDTDPIESFLIKIDLENNTISSEKVNEFIYGLEIAPD